MGCGGGHHSFLLRQRRDGQLEKLGPSSSSSSGGGGGAERFSKSNALLDTMKASLMPWSSASPTRWRSAGAEIEGGGSGSARLPDELSFRCGFTGYFGYDAWRYVGPASTATELRPTKFKVLEEGVDSQETAETAFLFADRVIAFEHA